QGSVRFPRPLRRFSLAALAAAFLWLQSPNAGAGASGGEIQIRGSTYQAATIALPTFDSDGSPVVLKDNNFHEIIYNDLEMTGYFQRAKNQTFVEETHQSDLKKGQTDFAEWRRIGADFLLEGKYQISGDQLEVTAVLYTVASGKRIFGKRFTNTLDQQRFLAHMISDEIMRYAASEEGVATTKICYVSTSDPTRQSRDVWIMDADGANPRQLTNDHSLVATPCWGANGTEIYYTSYKDYNPDLYGIYLKGGAPWSIARHPGLNVSPAWSEVKKRIALTLGKDGNSEIYTMDRDGKNLKRLTMDRAIDSSPHWSPAGTDLVFTSDRTGSPQIYVMDADGINTPQRISFVGSSYCDSAVWSPKGDKIAFAARMDGQFDIFVCEINGSNPVRLTRNQGNNEDPSWAPNGQMLAFSSDRTGSMQIYVMCADGTNQRALTRRGFNTSPAWSPQLVKK
ncbi:MAG: Tol-Pal system beta propeller repeat protein TolB, partial [Candidatus Sumerlaeia bacterium]|nr:Tol-Pal system beta propeller repeat protein TolB [Candidatus Sumerlaeia bacterium]